MIKSFFEGKKKRMVRGKEQKAERKGKKGKMGKKKTKPLESVCPIVTSVI